MVKAIIFDYYGVLTTDSYMTWLEHNPSVEKEHATQIEALSKAQDSGIDDNEFFSRLGQLAGQSQEEVRGEFGAHGSMHRELLDYIGELRQQGLKTAILSNSAVSLYDEVAKHQLGPLFDVILCSEEAGVAKPDPKMYHLALKRLNVSPDEALFVDDRQYNVNGAEAVGIDAVIYTGLTGLKSELKRRGIHSVSTLRSQAS